MSDSTPLTASFLKSAATLVQCPVDEFREIAFVGRSNVGKSSSLNKLTGSKNLARVSKTPGRTQLINLFDVRGSDSESLGRLVDLPGFGYAKASRKQRTLWSGLVDEYLTKRTNLTGIVLVMDARHSPFNFDQQMIEWCLQRQLQLLVLLNKSDKLKRNRQIQMKFNIEKMYPANSLLHYEIFSAEKGLGVDAVRSRLRNWLRN